MDSKVILSKIIKNLLLTKKRQKTAASKIPAQSEIMENNLWLYRPEGCFTPMPFLDGISMVNSWDRVLDIIKQAHAPKDNIKVTIYPCAPLQCLDAPRAEVESNSD